MRLQGGRGFRSASAGMPDVKAAYPAHSPSPPQQRAPHLASAASAASTRGGQASQDDAVRAGMGDPADGSGDAWAWQAAAAGALAGVSTIAASWAAHQPQHSGSHIGRNMEETESTWQARPPVAAPMWPPPDAEHPNSYAGVVARGCGAAAGHEAHAAGQVPPYLSPDAAEQADVTAEGCQEPAASGGGSTGEHTTAHASPGAAEHASTSSLGSLRPADSRSDASELSAAHGGSASNGYADIEDVSHSASLEGSKPEDAVAAPAVCLTSCSSAGIEGEVT